MHNPCPETFEREMGCTIEEWLGWLPAAIGDHPWVHDGDAVHIQVGGGTLKLRWQALPPRQIARLRLPRLWVRYAFSAVDDDTRRRFMRRFDLYMQRGGG